MLLNGFMREYMWVCDKYLCREMDQNSVFSFLERGCAGMGEGEKWILHHYRYGKRYKSCEYMVLRKKKAKRTKRKFNTRVEMAIYVA